MAENVKPPKGGRLARYWKDEADRLAERVLELTRDNQQLRYQVNRLSRRATSPASLGEILKSEG